MLKYSFLVLISISSTCFIKAQTNNPIPNKITPSGITIELTETYKIQPSSGAQPKARINMLREIPDGSGRKAVIDLRGILWLIDGENQFPFLKIKDFTNNFIDAPGKGTGFGSFAFHPDYAENGLFYTAHSEKTNSAPADFKPEKFNIIALQWVITEWKIDDPSKNVFSGIEREILRADFPGIIHGIQDIQFNPTASQENEDYGLLYICIGEGGSSLEFLSQNLQKKSGYLGSIFRIDPLGSNGKNGNYGFPLINPFSDEEDGIGEIFAYGFRNPHRISWDIEGNHTMYIGDIGEKNIEELNIGLAGHNYGWDEREGTFEYKRELGRDFVYQLPENDSIYDYTYPVAQYDHDEGIAIVGGYVYRGNNVPELYGHYIFGDIPSGRLFHVPVDQLSLGHLTEIKELTIVDSLGFKTNFLHLAQTDRADLRFGVDNDGEIYFLTKADGKIRKMKPTLSSSVKHEIQSSNLIFFPNPTKGILYLNVPFNLIGKNYEIINSSGLTIIKNIFHNSNTSINLSSFPNGVYFLKYNHENVSYVKELILTH